jgi:DNA-binding beta-propeller fold protein YncE
MSHALTIDEVAMVSTADNKVVGGPIHVGIVPFDPVVAPNGHFLYVLNGNFPANGSVSVIDISE